jgi:DnaJ family protein C protein 1
MIDELKEANAYNHFSKTMLKKTGKTQLDTNDVIQLVAGAFEVEPDTLVPVYPSWSDTWVVTLPKQLFHLIVNHKQVYANYKENRLQRKLQQEELDLLQREEEEAILREEEEQKRLYQEKQRMTEERKARKRAKHQAKAQEEKIIIPKVVKDPFGQKLEQEEKVNLSSTWTPEELSNLSQLLKKYPGGTVGRYIKVSKALNRRVEDVVVIVDKIKKAPHLVKDGIFM